VYIQKFKAVLQYEFLFKIYDSGFRDSEFPYYGFLVFFFRSNVEGFGGMYGLNPLPWRWKKVQFSETLALTRETGKYDTPAEYNINFISGTVIL
jgi:hypothetical protein